MRQTKKKEPKKTGENRKKKRKQFHHSSEKERKERREKERNALNSPPPLCLEEDSPRLASLAGDSDSFDDFLVEFHDDGLASLVLRALRMVRSESLLRIVHVEELNAIFTLRIGEFHDFAVIGASEVILADVDVVVEVLEGHIGFGVEQAEFGANGESLSESSTVLRFEHANFHEFSSDSSGVIVLQAFDGDPSIVLLGAFRLRLAGRLVRDFEEES